jgi:IS30 family transposase
MNWSRGYKTYRNGRVAGFVPALDRLAVREISARYLSQDERIEIADLRRAGISVRGIAQQTGQSPSTISRELRRNGRKDGYRPFDAHRRAIARRARHHRRRLETNTVLHQLVHELLMQRWSPQQIARHLRARYSDEPSMRLCHESIYQPSTSPASDSCARRRWRLCTTTSPMAAELSSSQPAGENNYQPCRPAARSAQ